MKSEGGYTVHDPEQCLPSELTGDRIPAADADPSGLCVTHIWYCAPLVRAPSDHMPHAATIWAGSCAAVGEREHAKE